MLSTSRGDRDDLLLQMPGGRGGSECANLRRQIYRRDHHTQWRRVGRRWYMCIHWLRLLTTKRMKGVGGSEGGEEKKDETKSRPAGERWAM